MYRALSQPMGWLRSLVITTGVLTLTWAFYARDVAPDKTRFPQVLDSVRFVLTDTISIPDVDINVPPVHVYGDGAQKVQHLADTIIVESLAWNINTGMGVITLIAGFSEVAPLAFMSGAWMLVFSVVQIAIVSTYTAIVCDPNGNYFGSCAYDSSIQFMGIWNGYNGITALVIVFYAFMGVITLIFATKSAKSQTRKSPPPAQLKEVEIAQAPGPILPTQHVGQPSDYTVTLVMRPLNMSVDPKTLEILTVDEGSEAFTKGVRPGHQVISLNGGAVSIQLLSGHLPITLQMRRR